jgi:hypothetical protein
METIADKFNALDKIKCFEIEVVNLSNNKKDYVVFDIKIEGNEMYATHESLTYKQANSEKVAYISIKIDEDMSLDANLQELYDKCYEAILHSNFFKPIN